MTLYAPTTETEVVRGKPRLHALVIGVADYPHLIGGDPVAQAKDPLALTQVTTPQYTAAAIANWLANDYSNPAVPLGSVELLISASRQGTPGKPPVPKAEGATMANIRSAFGRWVDRAGSNDGNIALFYFCGHGLAKVNQYLLPSDFGDPGERDSWTNCIAFDEMRVGMKSCRAQTQLYFVDACREIPYGVLTQQPRGDRLIDSGVGDSVECHAVYNAATEGKQAFGPDDGVSYFGRAVISSLNGVGALRRVGHWSVDTYSLGNSLGQVMDRLGRQHNLKLSCNPCPSGMADIHRTSTPMVFAVVGCRSEPANRAAEIVLEKGATRLHSPYGSPKPMYEEVEAGRWAIEVRFPNGEFPSPQRTEEDLMPPVFDGVAVP